MYKKCTNAVKVLNEFKDSPWPHQGDHTNNSETPAVNGEDSDAGIAQTIGTETEIETIATDDVGDDASEVVVEDFSSNVKSVGDEDENLEGEMDDVDVDDTADVDGDVDGDVDVDVDADSNGVGVAPNAVSFESIEMAEDNKNYEEAVQSDVAFDEDTKNFNSVEPLKAGIVNAESDDKSDNDNNNNDKVEAKTKKVLEDSMDTSTVLDDPADDGLDNEQMHPAIKTALSCYCSVINNENSTPKMIEIALECIGLLIENRYVVGSTISKPSSKSQSDDDSESDKKVSELLYLINCICERADNISDAVQAAIAKALLALMTSPVCGVYEAGMLKAVRTVFHIYLVTKHDSVKQVTRAVLLDMLRSVFSRMEAYDAMSHDESTVDELPPDLDPQPSAEDQQNTIFASRFHTDSYLLFRALCKLSAKLLPEDANDASSVASSRKNIFASSVSPSDPMATKTKILSLRLILSVFEHCGPAFRNGEKFIYAVQNFLCVSLVKNSMSNNPHVAHLSLKVFLLLVSSKAFILYFFFF